MTTKGFNKLVAYIYVPLIFAIVGLLVIFGMFYKSISFATGSIKMITAESIPEFEQQKQPPVKTSDIAVPIYGAFYADVLSDDLGLSAMIYYGDSGRIAQKGVVQSTPAMPGKKGTILLSARNDAFFWSLKDIRAGHIIKIKTSYGTFEYRIQQVDVGYLNAEDYNLHQTDKEVLMLKTNYPFEDDEEPKYDGDTLIAYGERVSGPDIEE